MTVRAEIETGIVLAGLAEARFAVAQRESGEEARSRAVAAYNFAFEAVPQLRLHGVEKQAIDNRLSTLALLLERLK